MESAVCTLESLAQRSRQLFTLPTVAMEVLRLTSDRQVDVEKIRACIEKDPAMVAKLLRVVNSSLFCMHGVVRDLPQALTLIGLNPLRLLVLGFCLPERLLKGIAEDVLAWYWRQTLTKAVAAREFAAVASPILADEVFVAALLRDIGMLLLIQELDKPYLKLVHRSISSKKDIVEIEKKAMGFDHVELSFKMMEGWGFPSSLQGREDSFDASEFDADSPGMAPRLLRVAELATDLFTSGKTSLFPALLEESQRLLGIEESRTEIILDSIEAKVRQLADVLSLKLPENLDYQSLLATARERLIAAADEAAEDLVQDGNRGGDEEETSPRLKKVIEDDIVRESRAATRRRDAQNKASARAAAGDKAETEEPETTRTPPRADDTVVEEDALDAQTAGSRSAGLAGLDTDALAAEVHGACGPFAVAEESASDSTKRAEPPQPGAGSSRAGAASGGRTRQAGPDGKGTSALDKSASSPEPKNRLCSSSCGRRRRRVTDCAARPACWWSTSTTMSMRWAGTTSPFSRSLCGCHANRVAENGISCRTSRRTAAR